MGSRRPLLRKKTPSSPEDIPPSPSVTHNLSRNTHHSSENVPPLPPENDIYPGANAFSTASRSPRRTDISGNDNNPFNTGRQQYHINTMPNYPVTHPSMRPPMFQVYQYPHYYPFNQINSRWDLQQAPSTFHPNWYNQQYYVNHGSNGSSFRNGTPTFDVYQYPYDMSSFQFNWDLQQSPSFHQNWHYLSSQDGGMNNNQAGTIKPSPPFGSQSSGCFTTAPSNIYPPPTEGMMRPSGSASQYYALPPQEMIQPHGLPAVTPHPSSAGAPLCPSKDSLSKEQADKFSSQIRQQIEYYFSEQNFPTDYFLKSLLDEDGWVSIHKIAKFNKIQEATNNFILEALQSSNSIEVQGNNIRRHFAVSTSNCQEVQTNSSFNSIDVSDKNSRVTVAEDNIPEAKTDLDICLSASDNQTVEPRTAEECMMAKTISADEALKCKRSECRPSLELEMFNQQSCVEPANNSADENSGLDNCLNPERSHTETNLNIAGKPNLKNSSNLNVCLNSSNGKNYSNDGMDDHNFEPGSFTSNGRDDSEHTSTDEYNDQLPNTRIDCEDDATDQHVPSLVTQETDDKKIDKYGLDTLSEKEATLIDKAVIRFQQDELAMHSICQRPNTVTKLFNHDTSFYNGASGGKQKNKGNSKSDSSNSLRLFSSNFGSCSNSSNQQETVSESLIGRSCFFLGPTPPENKDSHNELLSGTSPPVAPIHKYSEFHKNCISDWLSKGKCCSEEMFKLFRFWSYFLRENFIKSVYEKFKTLAIEDFSNNHDYGIQCLFRFFSYGLKKRFNEDIYEDFEKLAVEFHQNGYLYGVEKYWEFHHYRIMDKPLKMHPYLEKLLNEEYINKDDFHYKKIQGCHDFVCSNSGDIAVNMNTMQ